MQRRRFAAFLIALAVMAAPTAVQAQLGSSLSGVWRGVYSGGGGATTEFEISISDIGGALTGTTIERNAFGSRDAMFLLATVSGRRAGDRINFVKTYDGTGGISHSVTYEGRILPGGRRIVGTWTIGGSSQRGQFEMVR